MNQLRGGRCLGFIAGIFVLHIGSFFFFTSSLWVFPGCILEALGAMIVVSGGYKVTSIRVNHLNLVALQLFFVSALFS